MGGWRFVDRNPTDQNRRRQERQGVDDDGDGSGQRLDQNTADRRSGDV